MVYFLFFPTMGQMFQLWAIRVDGGDGKEIYGEDYADVYAMNRLHHKASANGTCNYVRNTTVWLVFWCSPHLSGLSMWTKFPHPVFNRNDVRCDVAQLLRVTKVRHA